MGTYFFRKGPVRILSRNEEGQLLGPARPGVYRVLLGNKLIDCPEDDLMPLGESPEERKVATDDRPRKGMKLGKFEAGPMFSTTIDIHGLSVRDAIEVVGRKINRALLADADRIKIVHDKRVTKLSKALHTYLSDLSFVQDFWDDAARPGITWVYLKGRRPDPELEPPRVDSPFLRALQKKLP